LTILRHPTSFVAAPHKSGTQELTGVYTWAPHPRAHRLFVVVWAPNMGAYIHQDQWTGEMYVVLNVAYCHLQSAVFNVLLFFP